MSERVLDRVMALADQFKEQAVEAEKIGRLTDATVKSMKSVGSIRLLQPMEHGGYEVHPREFAETVMATAALDPAAGWINGVVGVHPYQLAYADPRVAGEVWADDVDTWVASPYAPQGMAKPVDGGYLFNGRWQFSSGTDACDWIILGAMIGDADGKPLMPPQMLHMILPRSDYQIVEDSWDVVGLRGTGSKDVIVEDAFVPDYRTMDAMKVMDGTAQREAGMTEPLYLMPWSTMFPLGISAATIGIAEGALAAHLDYQRERVNSSGVAIKDDPYVMYAIGEAAADINAARQELLVNADRIYDMVAAGKDVSFEDRAAGRRTQVRAVWRAVSAVDEIFARSGGNAARMDKPLQRYWRDVHVGQAHAIHVPGTVFHASALSSLGVDPQGPLRAMIWGTQMSDLKSLGYVKVQATDMNRWRHFAFKVLGFAEGSGPEGEALYLRMDERAARIIVVPGDVDRIVTVGWEVRDHAALTRVRAALNGAGVPVKDLSVEEADARRVEEVIAFDDPAGTATEVFHGAVLDHSPVVTPFGARFVTGDQGLGHVVLPALDAPGLFQFYTDVLGFKSRGTFRVPTPPEFGPIRVRFLGINERHHSLAICPAMTLRDPGLIHLMVEVDSLDAVGQALDRVNKDGFQLSSTLGRHTNDKMVSFYVRAPGDWDIEFGTDGMRVDETHYTAEEITADSYWGHEWVSDLPAAMRP